MTQPTDAPRYCWSFDEKGRAAWGLMTQPTDAPRYCWSFDEEGYHGDFATREEALVDAEDTHAEDGIIRCWTAMLKPARDFLDPSWVGDAIHEYVAETLYEVVGEWSENFDMTKAQRDELGKIVIAHLDTKVGFRCYGIDPSTVVKHELT